MNYLTVFLSGTIVGLIFHVLISLFLKKKSEPLATREDVRKMMEEIGKMRHAYKNNSDLREAEQEFYDENGIE